jgi:hypothetical protein
MGVPTAEQKLLVTSAHAQNRVQQVVVQRGVAQLVRYPLHWCQLDSAVRELLAAICSDSPPATAAST